MLLFRFIDKTLTDLPESQQQKKWQDFEQCKILHHRVTFILHHSLAHPRRGEKANNRRII